MSRTATLKGKPFDLEGKAVKVGDVAPDATLKKSLVEDFKLSQGKGRTRIFSVVPSLDTAVCAEQTRRFNKEIAALPDVDVYTISMDLPMAMNRFCGAESINTERVKPLSDHADGSFGRAYGTLIPSLRIQSRAVFVVGPDDKIRYAEYVPEIADHPNYTAVLDAAKKK